MGKRRMLDMEECCKRLTSVANKQITTEELMDASLKSIKVSLDKHISNFEKYDKAEMLKYTSIQKDINSIQSNLSSRISEIEKRIYIVTGAIGIVMFLSKFVNLKIG